MALAAVLLKLAFCDAALGWGLYRVSQARGASPLTQFHAASAAWELMAWGWFSLGAGLLALAVAAA